VAKLAVMQRAEPFRTESMGYFSPKGSHGTFLRFNRPQHTSQRAGGYSNGCRQIAVESGLPIEDAMKFRLTVGVWAPE
jgi:hypothetical protein